MVDALTAVPAVNVKIGDRTYNLLDAFPMTLGDWEDLNEIGVMDGAKMTIIKPKQMLNLLHLLLKKIDNSVTRDQVRALTVKEMPDLSKVMLTLLGLEEKQTENPTISS